MANAERLMLLADSLGKVAEFNMLEWIVVEDCGTQACLAGHAAILAGADFDNCFSGYCITQGRETMIIDAAQDWLDITDHERTQLFVPWANAIIQHPEDTEYYKRYLISAEQAAEVVRNFAATGEIVWP